jgi:hypothetical protein
MLISAVITTVPVPVSFISLWNEGPLIYTLFPKAVTAYSAVGIM